MIETEILENLFKFTNSKEIGIVFQSIWLFANMLENDELCHIIIKTVPEFLNKINLLLTNYSSSYDYYESYNIVSWLVYRIFYCTNNYYLDSFIGAIPNFLKVLEIEVNKQIHNKISGSNNENLEIEFSFRGTILLVFDKLTRYIEDTEILQKLIYSSLMDSLMKLLSIDLENQTSDNLFIIFRIIGGLLSSNNDSDVDYLLNNYNYLDEVEKIIKHLAYNNYPNISNPSKILKEIAWCLSNVTGGTKEQIQKVLKTEIPSYLLNFTHKIKENKYFNEVLFLYYNAFDYGSKETKHTILSGEIVNIICEAISNTNFPHQVVKLALDFLRLIISEVKTVFEICVYKNLKIQLERNNIPIILNNLQYSRNNDIVEIAEFILLDNWHVDEY